MPESADIAPVGSSLDDPRYRLQMMLNDCDRWAPQPLDALRSVRCSARARTRRDNADAGPLGGLESGGPL
jgi:hypothetical protein